MKRSFVLILILTLMLVFVLMLAACSDVISSFRFKYDTYTIYMDEGVTFMPEVIITPANANYSLSSSNTSFVTVLEDGKTLKALKSEVTVTITATSSLGTITAQLNTLTTRQQASPNIPDTNYTVTFDTDGWGSVVSQKVAPGGTATRPSFTSYSDFVIADWYLDEDHTILFDFTTKITSNLTLYALWIPSDSPSFNFMEKNGQTYVSGLAYPYVEYGDIAIPDTYNGKPVVGISEGAFYKKDTSSTTSTKNMVSFTSIVIPSSITVIEKNAFFRCTSLTAVYFDGDSSLTTIGVSAFSYCEKLTDITLPDGVTTIEDSAFEQCIALKSINLPDSITKIAIGAFLNCKVLDITKLPSSLTQISSDSFKNTAIKSLDLKNITKIGTEAFYGATSLSKIENTQNIVSVGSGAFTSTAWIKAEEAKKPTFIILDDILLLCLTTGNVFVTVPENIRLVASNAFPAKTISNGFIHFTASKPPVFNDYAIGSEGVDICVPKELISTYRTNIYSGLGMTRMNLYYIDNSVYDGLTLYVDEYTKNQINIIIQSFESNVSEIDFNNIFTKKYTGLTINIKKIKTNAFTNKVGERNNLLPNLTRVVLPPRLYSLELNSFFNLSKLTVIRIEGDYGDYSPTAQNIPSSAASVAPNSIYGIYVPKNLLSLYESRWSSLKNRIYGY